MKKRTFGKVRVLIAVVLISAVVSCLFTGCSETPADSDVDYVDNNNIAESTTVNSADSDYKTSYSLTEELYDFQIEINNNVYDFPMSVEEFMKCGWNLGKYEDASQKIGSGKYDLIWFSLADGSQVNAYVVNYSKSEQLYSDCYVSGVQITYNEVNFNINSIKMAKNISFGVSTLEDIVDAYGEYQAEFDSDSYKMITYRKDNYKDVDLYIYNDTKTLGKADIFTNDEPSESIDNEVYDEIPDIVSNYKAPVAPGNTVTSGVVELDGILYQMPIPVNELLKNGWQIDENVSDSEIAGNDNGIATFINGEKKIDFVNVLNYTEKNVSIENCVIENLSSTKIYNADFTVPGYFDVDMTLDEIKNLASSNNAETEDTEDFFRVSFRDDNNTADSGVSFDKKANKVSYYWVNVEK